MILKDIVKSLKQYKFWIVVFVAFVGMIYSSMDDSWGNVMSNTEDITSEQLLNLKRIYANANLVWEKGFVIITDFVPFIVTIPVAYELVKERQLNFSNFSIIREGKKKYYISKLITAGIVGSLALIIPEVIYTGWSYIFFKNYGTENTDFANIILGESVLECGIPMRIGITLGLHLLYAFSLAIFAQGIVVYFHSKISAYVGFYLIYLAIEIILSLNQFTSNFMLNKAYSVVIFDCNIIKAIAICITLIIAGIIGLTVNVKVEG